MANTLQEGTRGEFQAQAPLWAGLVKPGALTERVLALLRSMDGEHTRFGFQVNGYEHSLQTATLAHREGEPEEDVVVALLHDVGEEVFAAQDMKYEQIAPTLPPAGVAASIDAVALAIGEVQAALRDAARAPLRELLGVLWRETSRCCNQR